MAESLVDFTALSNESEETNEQPRSLVDFGALGDEEPGVIGGIARGAAVAPISLVRGIAELGAGGLDFALDTDYARSVSDAFEAAEDFVGGELGTSGEITRDLLVFGAGAIPIAGWIGRAGQVAKTGKGLGATSRFMKSAEKFGASKPGKALLGNRAKVLGTTALATGLYDGVVSSDGRATLSDSFEFLPAALKTEADTGLTGREEAARQFRNRLRQAAEASALGATFDAALYALGRGSRQLGELPVVGDTLSATARTLMKGWDVLGAAAGAVPGASIAKQKAVKYFAPGGGLDPVIRANILDVQGVRAQLGVEEARLLSNYDRAVEKVAKESARVSKRKDVMKQIEADVSRFFDAPVGNSLEQKYGPRLQKAVEEMIEAATEQENRLYAVVEDIARGAPRVDVSFMGPNPPARGAQQRKAEELLKILQANKANQKTHLTRVYEIHRDPIAWYKKLGGKNLMDNEKFKAAEDHLTNKALSKPGSAPKDEAIVRASVRRVLLDALQLNPLENELNPAGIEQAIRGRIATLKKEVLGESGKVVATDTPVLKIQRGILQERKPLMEEAPVRALLGEITSPRERIGYMLDSLYDTNTSLQFYRQQARGAIDAATALRSMGNGARPMYVYLPTTANSVNSEKELADLSLVLGAGGSTDDLLKGAKQTLAQRGYVALGEENLDDIAGGRFGALSGVYVPEELRDSLVAPLQLGTNGWSQLGSIVQQAKGLSQKMTVVPSIPAKARDYVGNKFMVIGTGNAASGFGTTHGQQLLTVYRGLQNLDQEGTEALAEALTLTGLADSNVTLNILKSIQQEGAEFGVPKAFKRTIEKFETKTPIMSPMLDFFEKTTRGIDTLAKTQVYLGEQAKLRELVGAVAKKEGDEDFALDWMQRNGLIDRTKTEIDLLGKPPRRVAEPTVEGRQLKPVTRGLDSYEVAAAARTRKFMPTYGELGRAVRAADRYTPFGNFTSFASETVRNMANILEQGVKELSVTVTDDLIEQYGEQGARQFVRMIRGHGAQRLTGLLAVSSVVPKSMVLAGQSATNMTDEQMDRLHEQVDYFQKGQDIVPLEFSGDGTVRYINLSYVAPYSFVTDSVQAALRGYSERGRLDKNEAQQITGALYDFVASLADPFASEAMVLERVRDALPSSGPGSLFIGRGGVTSTGAKIYEQEAPLGDKLSEGFLHVLDSLAPMIARELYTGRKGDFEEGRFMRAMLGVPDPRGKEFNPAEEIGRQITGFTPMVLDLKKDAEFAGKAYSPKRTSVKKIATRMIKRSDATLPEIMQSWSDYLDGLYRVQSELYNEILGMRELGLSDTEIRRNLIQKAKLGTVEVNTIMRGEFYPGLASKELRKEVLQQVSVEERPRIVRDVPWGDLNQLSNDRRGQLLAPEQFRRTRADMLESPAAAQSLIDFSTLGAGESSVVPTQAPQSLIDFSALGAGEPAAAPTPAAPTAPQQPPAQELLGGNLFDRLRNMEIFQRQQQ